jgi:pyruvate dehydrogenase E2 component (dihydrolipoamide acetyltransferase)
MWTVRKTHSHTPAPRNSPTAAAHSPLPGLIMPTPITIPRLGWSMEEGTFGEWLKAAGETVAPGEMLFSLEGEKATQEIEALDGGVLCIPDDAPRSGDIVQVGQVIGFLLAAGEAPPASVGPQRKMSSVDAPATQPVAPTMSRAATPSARRLAWEMGIDLNAVPTPDPTGRVLGEDIERAAQSRRAVASPISSRTIATPRARRRAQELNIDWTKLTGSGRGGRVREHDVIASVERSGTRSVEEWSPTVSGEHRPASRMRRTIAQRMLAGVQQTAPVTITTKVDASALVAWRLQRKAVADGAIIPSYNDLLVKLAAVALSEQPQLNACWYRDGIYQYDVINMAIAVDTDAGLVAPVIADVDRLTVDEIAKQSRTLIEQARAGAVSPAQLQGGTFTITNLGMFDIDAFTPVINLPQAAILGVGRIVQEPVVRDNAIIVGETLTLSLTFDHRVVDGAPAARWLQRLSQLIQQPSSVLNGI